MEYLNKCCLEKILDQTAIEEKQKETHATVDRIDYISDAVSYNYFFFNYLLPNRACILGPWATEKWRSRKEWVSKDSKPDYNFLKLNFDGATVPVADCKQEMFSSHLKRDMSMAEYMEYIRNYGDNDYHPDLPCYYLKDWHFVRDFPMYGAYTTPPFFLSDWLNEYWDHREGNTDDDYRFVYIGPKGSWTPFHADVFRSYSWSANICGRKKWIFFPPGEEENLKDRYGNLVFDLTAEEMKDDKKFPKRHKVARRFEVFQEEGEVIFVPSRWHHQVFNMEDTISINHNWVNGCNVCVFWRHLVEQLNDVQEEIRDCIDMEEWGQQCQLILKASSGIDYKEFFNFVFLIGSRRLAKMEDVLEKNPRKDASVKAKSEESTPKEEGRVGVERLCMDCEAKENVNCKAKGSEQGDSKEGILGHVDLELDSKLASNKERTAQQSNNEADECSKMTSDLDLNLLHDDCYHILFDLLRVEAVLQEMFENKEFVEITNFDNDPKEFYDKIGNGVSLFKEKLGMLGRI